MSEALEEKRLHRLQRRPCAFFGITGAASRNNVTQRMIAAFAEWDDMILGQMAFGSCLTIGAAMVKSGLQHEPLGMGEIIDSRIISLGTAAATLSGIDVRMFFVVDFPSYENLSAMRCIVLLASRNLLLSMSLTPRLKLLGMGGAIGSLFGEIVCMIRKIARASFM